jgi:hypothetical protein
MADEKEDTALRRELEKLEEVQKTARVKKKRERETFPKELQCMTYGFGDDQTSY